MFHFLGSAFRRQGGHIGLVTGTSILALSMAGFAQSAAAQDSASAATAQSAEADEQDTAGEIIVTGFRASLARGADIKRNSDQVVDAISSEELGKLPDQNIAEGLQRITGVQIQRSGGEGNKFQIRGSDYNLTLVNGREVAPDGAFGGASVTPNRQINLFNYPSELFGEIVVYKSPVASQVEGGVGGTVDLRMPDPLRAKPRTVVSVEGGYLSLSKKASVQATALTSNRFFNDTLGVLIGATYFKRDSASDAYAGGSYFLTNNIDTNGDGTLDPRVALPFNMTYSRQLNHRTRSSLNGLVTWEPSPIVSMRLEGTYIRQTTDNDRGFIAFNMTNARHLTTPSPLTTKTEADGSITVLAGSLRNVLVSQDGLAQDEGRSIYQGAFSTTLRPTDHLTISAEFAGSKSDVNNYMIVYQAYQPSITATIDMRSEVPGVQVVTGGAFNDPAALRAYVMTVRRNTQNPDLLQARTDIGYEFDDGGFIKKIAIGGRTTRQGFDNLTLQQRYQNSFPIGTNYPLNQFPEYVRNYRPDNFFAGASGNFPREFIVPTVDPTPENGAKLLSQVGYNGPLLPLATSNFDIRERTYAGYVQVDWQASLFGRPLSGNIGARYVKTKLRSSSSATSPSGAISPITYTNDYDDFLPSLNAKLAISDRLTARVSASKVMSRPPIENLSAGTNITFSSGLNSASSGQPGLQPFRATQFDAGLEYYFPDDGFISAAFFYKDIGSFITTSSVAGATLPGQPGTYFLTTPTNGPGGVSKGFEAGIQRTLGFLSKGLNDFGFILNYTYVDSKRSSSNLPIEDTSKHSFNAVGFFESGPFQARVAYNWRDKRYLGFSRNSDNFANARGQLDFSASIDVTKNVTLTLEGIDLLQGPQTSYAQYPDRLNGYEVNDRRIFFGVRTRF